MVSGLKNPETPARAIFDRKLSDQLVSGIAAAQTEDIESATVYPPDRRSMRRPNQEAGRAGPSATLRGLRAGCTSPL